MNQDIPTPRTDALIEDAANPSDVEYVSIDFARDLERELAEKQAEYSALGDLYMELIMEVGKKHGNETRHETVLRYIRRAEHGHANACDAMFARDAETDKRLALGQTKPATGKSDAAQGQPEGRG